MSIKAPRGTGDILPGEAEKWQIIEGAGRRLFLLYNYREIITPLFEDTCLFERSIGGSTDIVEKEMYTFLDKKGRSLTLRPEGTAPVVRAYLENKLYAGSGVKKFFYIGPFFRYERPQAGRKRQFYQVGVEAIGTENPALDVEVIDLSLYFLGSLGLKRLSVSLNSIGCSVCQSPYREKLKRFLSKHCEKLCNDCQRRTESNTLRVLDCKKEGCSGILKDAPSTLDFLCEDCKRHFESVKHLLDMLGVDYRIVPNLVRGLDYYTRTTFEIMHSGLGAQNAVSAGGRFDSLIEEFGGEPTPAVGFAAGLDRIAIAMDAEKVWEEDEIAPFAFIALAGEYIDEGVVLLNELRHSGISVDMDYGGRSLKSQFRTADRLGVKFTVILGQDGVSLRDMEKGEQKQVRREEIVGHLERKLKTGA